MNFFSEIKNRFFLVFFVWFYLIFICYYYKKVLFFIILNKSLLYNKKLQIYFVYTNITELFFIYLQLIHFISLQIIFWFFCYNLFTFILPALYKNEFVFLKRLTINLMFHWCINFLIIIFLIFPITWEFFENFQKIFIINLVYFEIKINEYFNFFLETYFILQFYILFFIFIILFFKSFYKHRIYTISKFRKFNYLIITLILVIFNPIDLINQIILYILLTFYYEISLIFHFFNIHLTKSKNLI